MNKSVELIGPQHGDCYGRNGTHTAAVGWKGLTIGDIKEGRAAPYRIDRNGTPIGWAPKSSIRVKPGVTIFIGIMVIVVGK